MFYSFIKTFNSHNQTRNPLFIYILWSIPSSESTGWSHRKDHQVNVWFLGRIWIFVLFCSASSIHPHQIPITTPVTTWTIRLLFPVRNRLVMNFLSLLKIKSFKIFLHSLQEIRFYKNIYHFKWSIAETTSIFLSRPSYSYKYALCRFLQSLLTDDHLSPESLKHNWRLKHPVLHFYSIYKSWKLNTKEPESRIKFSIKNRDK